MKTKYFGFTLVETLISVTILAIVSSMILISIIQLGKSSDKTKNLVKTRKQLSTFTQGIYNFINKSKGIYFKNIPPGNEKVNYLSSFPSVIAPGNPILDTLYLIKDDAETMIGHIYYDPTLHTLSYYKDATAVPELMLSDVYRMDGNDTIPGTAPIFRFPHKSTLYKVATPTQPLFVIIEFRKRVSKPTSVNTVSVFVPVNLMCKVNALA